MWKNSRDGKNCLRSPQTKRHVCHGIAGNKGDRDDIDLGASSIVLLLMRNSGYSGY